MWDTKWTTAKHRLLWGEYPVTRVEKTPAMPLYGKDAYDDETFGLLSFGAQGLYFYLGWWQWQEGSIPADLEVILDKVPRRKVNEARRLWPDIEQLFPVLNGGQRRQSPSVEKRRADVLAKRGAHQKGAAITNAKRTNSETLSVPNSAPLSDSESVSPRTATATALATAIGSPPFLVERETPFTPPPDFTVVASLAERISGAGLAVEPTLQIVTAWLTEYGEALILETLVDCGPRIAGKNYAYLEKILIGRQQNPSERPANRRGEKHAAAVDFTPEDPALMRLDTIREAARLMKKSTDLEAKSYLKWLAPDGQMRDDAMSFDEWKVKEKVSA